MTLHIDITRRSIPRLITLFGAEDGEAIYRQQEQDLELTVEQIILSLLQNQF